MVVCSLPIVTCPLIDGPKFYGKCGRNANTVMHLLLGFVIIVTDALSFSSMVEYSIQSGFTLSFTLEVSFITLFSIKSIYGVVIHYAKITTSVCPCTAPYEG